MIKNRFQITEKAKDGTITILRGMVFKFYDGATKAAGRLARSHPSNIYYIIDKQENVEYQFNQVQK